MVPRKTASAPGRRDLEPRPSAANPAAIVALLTLFALPFACEAARLVLTGRCAMAEDTLMSALRNLGLGLAAMAHRPAYARLSALVSLFLVTVASPVGGEGGMAVLVPVGGFAVAGTLWLMLVYWKGLGIGEGAGLASRRLPLSGVAWVLAVVGVLAAVAAVGPSRAATALAALVPTSGGNDWSDPDARSGVNDGDNEVGASEHPESVGFTESEVYLETDRPSLYDAFNESYGEPFKPKKVNKMIALGQQDVGEQKERPSENLQAGREFAAVRRKPEPRRRRPGERTARALVYVKGPTPLHLPLTSYSHFNGTTWREERCCNQRLPAEPEPTGSWLRLWMPPLPFLAGSVAHQVKIGTLESSPMPIPAHPVRFRVGSVNRLEFFGWARYGIIRMTDRTVPAGTVIDSESLTVDPERLRSLAFPPQRSPESDHQLSFQGEYAIDPAVADLAMDWATGLPEGWGQVEAVIAALRSGYTHDRSATAPPACTDVVAEFLLRSRRGPDYLFASSAVVLLRSLGYPARAVSGLYAAPGRYDPRTRHTPVTGDDVHFWAEVRIAGRAMGRRRADPRLRADAPGPGLVRPVRPGPPGRGTLGVGPRRRLAGRRGRARVAHRPPPRRARSAGDARDRPGPGARPAGLRDAVVEADRTAGAVGRPRRVPRASRSPDGISRSPIGRLARPGRRSRGSSAWPTGRPTRRPDRDCPRPRPRTTSCKPAGPRCGPGRSRGSASRTLHHGKRWP